MTYVGAKALTPSFASFVVKASDQARKTMRRQNMTRSDDAAA